MKIKDRIFSVSFTWLSVVLLLWSSIDALAQRPSSTFPGGTNNGRSTGGSQGGGDQRETQPDTFGVFIFQVDNPNEELPFADTLLTDFHQYDPTRLQVDDYAHLGLVGSAHQPLVYSGRDRGGLDLGWHQYDLYYTTGRTMPYYRLERPFTNLAFTQGSEQRDNIISVDFSRNFANGINFVIDYRTITQESQATQYPNQRNQTRSLATGFWIHSKNGVYDGFISYAANTTNTEDNGGIISLPVSGEEFSLPATADVLLDDGRSRHALREVMYTHYYRFGGKTDTTGRTSRSYTLSHQFDYDKNTYRFADTYGIGDTSFYNRFPSLEVDLRGARYFVEQKTIENSFRLSTFKLAQGDREEGRKQRDLLEVGLTHRYNDIYQEPVDTIVNNLMLTGKIGLRPGKRLRLQIDALLALFDQAGDYRIKGQLDADFGKIGQLTINLRNQLYQPTLLQERFYLFQEALYQENFSKTLDTRLGAIYYIPSIQVKLGAQYHLLTDYIYFDSTAMPKQADKALSILQFSAQKDFKLGPLTLFNRIVLQQTDDDILRLPNLFGKHSLVYNGRWFRKVLNVQLGVDLRYATNYQADYYNPFIAQFQLQDRQEVELFPALDAYFSMRVTRFRAFIKGENLTTLFQPDQRLFLSAFYPWPEAGIRFGVSWRLLD
ncbi:MAG: putative porin [Bacteroidota bacterium]